MTSSSNRQLLGGLALIALASLAGGMPQNQHDVSDVEVHLIDGACQTISSEVVTVLLPDGSMMESVALANGAFRFVDAGSKFTLLFNRKGSTIEPIELSLDGSPETVFVQICMDPASGEVKEVATKALTKPRLGKKKPRTLAAPGGASGISGDDCDDPLALVCGGSTTLDNTSASTVAGDPAFSCHFGGAAQGVGSMWLTFVATDTSAFLDTNASLVSDTLLAVYSGTCGNLTEIGCSEDEGVGLRSELCVENLSVGTTYYVQVASFSAASQGEITVSITCPCEGPPANDACEGAVEVGCDSVTTFDNSLATTDAGDPVFSCHFGGAAQGVGTMWFTFVATSDSAHLDTNLSVVSDTLLAVYSGDCGALVEIACSEDEGVGLRSELDALGLTPGATYHVQVASFSPASQGEITLTISCGPLVDPEGRCCFDDGTCADLTEDDCFAMGGSSWDEGLSCGANPCPIRPDNDDCEDAEDLGALPASVTFDNSQATDDIAVPCGVASGPWKNVWYRVTGTGGLMTATTCNAGTVVTDTKISVFCSDCVEQPCVGGNDDDCPGGGPIFSSSVSWCSQAGVEYLITVGNFSAFTVPGIVQLDVVDEGIPCNVEVSCVPTGACCLADGTCVIASFDECTSQGGTYIGDGTACESNIVNDPSFEGGAFGGNWVEFSLNFGTPLCDPGSCGFGGGTGPNTGDWWAWFGGIGSFEAGSIDQDVVIPVGASTLSFQLEIPAASGNGIDFMDVLVDGNVLYTATEADGPYLGYLPVSVDISAYADGGLHTLRFESETTGNPAITNFFVDDVSIGVPEVDCRVRECVTLDFETEDDFATPLVNGQDISTGPEFGNLVAISGFGPNFGPAIFDTSEFGPNFGGADEDLLVRTGNALILQRFPAQTVPGIFDVANDAEGGGTLRFDFVLSSELLSIDLIDVDLAPGNQDVIVTMFDAAGATRSYFVPRGWTEDIAIEGAPGYRTLDLTSLANQPGAHATATGAEDAGFDALNVVRLEVFLFGSTAVDNLSLCQ